MQRYGSESIDHINKPATLCNTILFILFASLAIARCNASEARLKLYLLATKTREEYILRINSSSDTSPLFDSVRIASKIAHGIQAQIQIPQSFFTPFSFLTRFKACNG
ncbi:hypothetical protein BD769DRAFT_1473703 [Suillus cothurnatus]|nr:hypothetical protein BD769DRAFT_1473703 [Suillus cothurnatus]